MKIFLNAALWILALAGLYLVTPAHAADTAAQTRPNIVVLVADDWGFTDVGAFGSEISTPNLDALAASGARFSDFHAAASCSPTRSMLLTGVDNHRNGVGNMNETMPAEHLGKPGYLSVLDTNVVTIASLLQDSGYRTYAAGKWHVGKEPHNLPNQRGFDRSIVQGDSGSDNWEPAKRYIDFYDKVAWFEDGKEAKMPPEYYSSEFYVNKTIEYISSGQDQNKPFFAYVAFQANHIPLQAPKSFIDKYHGVYDAGWTALRASRRDKAAKMGLVPAGTPMVTMSTTRDWDGLSDEEKHYFAHAMEVYAGMAEAMDFHIGRLVAHLKSTGEFDNTVFVFLSDNGAEASDPYASMYMSWWLDRHYKRDIDSLGLKGGYGLIRASWASAAASPLNTYKFYAGEGGIRVPLIISGVHGMKKNQIQHGFAHITDIVPTLLELTGTPQSNGVYKGKVIEPLIGASLLPVLRGEAKNAHSPDQPIGYELSGNMALFKGDLKLVSNLQPMGDGQWHLYDIQKDPGETIDLKDQMPDVFTAMQADYQAYAKANQVLPMPPGYQPLKQAFRNAIVNVYIPRYRMPVLIILGGLAALAAAYFIRRRRRSALT